MNCRCGSLADAWMLLILLLVHYCGCYQSTSITPSAQQTLPIIPYEAMEATVQAQVRAAERRCDESPDSAVAMGEVGMLLQAYAYFDLAEAYYERALETEGNNPRWWYYLGMVREEQGALEEAAAAYRKALARDPDDQDAPTRLRIADVERSRNRYEQALDEYERVIELGVNRALAHCGAGQACLAMNDAQRALEHLERAIALEPNYGAARYALGMALRKLGRDEEAAVALQRAEADRDRVVTAVDSRAAAIEDLATGAVRALRRGIEAARSAESTGDLHEAIQLLEEATRIDPGLMEAHAQLGAARLLAGQIEDAERSLNRAVELSPDAADALYNLGLIEHRRDDLRAAAKRYRQVIEIRPDHFDARLALGIAMSKTGQSAEAIEHLQAAMALRRDDPRAYKHLGTQFKKLGLYAQAVAVLQKGRAAIPNDLSIEQRLAWLLATSPVEQVRDPRAALVLAQHACGETSHPIALDTLAAALAAYDRFEEAVQVAERAQNAAKKRGDQQLAKAIAARREAYLAGEPYRLPLIDAPAD